MEPTSLTSAEPRFRRRLPCSLRVGDEEHRALILNLSRGGLFVRTTARVLPGDHVEVQIAVDASPAPVELGADVVWRRISNSTVSRMTDGGIGLQLDASPEAYCRFVAELAGEPPAPTVAEDAAAADVPLAETEIETAAEVAADAAVETAVEAAVAQRACAGRFEVLLKLRGAPRSRCLRVEAADAAEASTRALAEAGDGWEILEVRRRSASEPSRTPS